MPHAGHIRSPFLICDSGQIQYIPDLFYLYTAYRLRGAFDLVPRAVDSFDFFCVNPEQVAVRGIYHDDMIPRAGWHLKHMPFTMPAA